ncbi:Glycosyl transferase, group 2 protein [Pseudomonas caricapapayae]|uniref:Glycosyl transferase, group 2 protein n=1 Tax=Pseudomonas caricapapayae TaxID=46678 RepID=A0A3M6EYR5_9PSED|nr:glycosyltransferase [Pseudomonas caricapapayae]RMV73482.1 Glycosyl transferase, group 2 protein [Pseudomonas caricapapayae]
MNSVPLVSIVIPAFNSRFFRTALQSALNQVYDNLEIIVCDDCPGDEIRAIFDELVPASSDRARYLRNPRRLGFQGNLLKGLEEAQGDYIKFLCDDDRLFPYFIAHQADVLHAYEDVSLVVGRRHLVDIDDYVLPPRMENVGLVPYDALFKGEDMLAIFERTPRNYLGGFSAALMRRSDVLEYLPSIAQPGQGFVALLDFTLFICLLRRGNLVALHTIENVEREHPGRFSSSPEIAQKATTEWAWLNEMLKARSGEQAPAQGWVRFLPLRKALEQPREWDEVGLYGVMASRQGIMNSRVGSKSASYAELYTEWLSCREFSAPQKKLNENRIAHWTWQPRIVPVIIDPSGDAAGLDITLRSIAEQDYAADSVVVLTNASVDEPQVLRFPLQADWTRQLNEILPLLENADWVYLLRAGDRLTQPALLVLAERIAQSTGLLCIYSDEGALVDEQSKEPIFKPDFNLDLMRAYPYVGRTLAFERRHLLDAGGFDPLHGELAPHDFIWRLVEGVGPQTIEHIAEVQVESTLTFAEWLSLPRVIEHNESVVSAHLTRIGREHVIHHDQLPLLNRIEYVHAGSPLVSVIITTRDQLAALERCVDSLLSNTSYPHYEVLIVDNASESADARAWFTAMGELGSDKLRIYSLSEPVSEARAQNLAAGHANGDYLVMLSPHAVLHQADWLQGMLNHAQRPEVGIVGPRIVNPQGNILYAGMVMGMEGLAGRPFFNFSAGASSYMQRLQLTQNWSAVSGNCLMVRKDVFDSVGEMEAATFTQGLQDLDLCMRVGREGYLIVGTPDSSLVLAEPAAAERSAASREALDNDQKSFYQKWLPKIARDPAYNPNLNLNEPLSFDLDPGLLVGWNPFCTRHLPSIFGMMVNSSAVGHYRVSQPLLELMAAGRVVGRMTYESVSPVEVERVSPDVIVFQGRYTEPKVKDIVLAKNYSNAMRIFELDDYIADVPERNEHRRNMPDNIAAMLRKGIGLCDRVVVSTQPLAQALSSMHSDIRVVPNMLATHLWSSLKSQRRSSGKPRIGWGGGTSHRGDLELIVDVVRELADEVEWVFFGMCPDLLKPYIHEFHTGVSLQTYPAKLASLNLDLALAPLEFHIFNDCKSNLRLLEYGACGYPVICSDTEAYRGHLPATRVYTNSSEEWLQAIRMHLSDPDASYRMGDELRETVLRDFMLRGENLQYWANGWLPD